jgi:predicted transcriptional regulator
VTLVEPHASAKDYLSDKVKDILSKTPGLSIKEIARASNVSRQFMAGFLKALEEKGDVYSRKVGPARIYFNNEVKNSE